jgi:hypothetical protein
LCFANAAPDALEQQLEPSKPAGFASWYHIVTVPPDR